MKAVLIALTKNRLSHRLEGFILAISPKVETVTDFIFLGLKITVDSDCSHEMKRRLLLGRKTMTNLDSIQKIEDITLLTKVHIWFFHKSCTDVRVGS